MKIRSYAFKADPVYAYMEKISALLNAPLQNENTLQIPASRGVGFIKNFFLEDEFCIRYYNFRLNNAATLPLYFDSESDDVLYKLMFRCTTVPGCTNEMLPLKHVQGMPDNMVILYASETVPQKIITANTWVKKIVLIFSKAWLEENFMDASAKIAAIISMLDKKKKPSFISEIMGQSYFLNVNDLAGEMNKDVFPAIRIKTKSLVLLNEFLNKVVEKNEAQLYDQKSLYYEPISKVEERLKEYLLTTMPSIAQLSMEFNMSPSTLQRHFKLIYGKNIYQYYLEQKLIIGREMISSKKKTISEVAYLLGYNKINSFSKVFKKYFGVLPKEINNNTKIKENK